MQQFIKYQASSDKYRTIVNKLAVTREQIIRKLKQRRFNSIITITLNVQGQGSAVKSAFVIWGWAWGMVVVILMPSSVFQRHCVHNNTGKMAIYIKQK